MDLVVDVDVIEHNRTTLHKERRQKVNWERTIFVDVWQFRCSCGWRTGWVQNHDRGAMRANAHAFDGQTSFPWTV